MMDEGERNEKAGSSEKEVEWVLEPNTTGKEVTLVEDLPCARHCAVPSLQEGMTSILCLKQPQHLHSSLGSQAAMGSNAKSTTSSLCGLGQLSQPL